jgi:hypothetical protein
VTVNRGDGCPVGPEDYSNIHVRYLGAAGFVFEYGTNAILTAPFFSNYSFVRSGLGPLWPKAGAIDRLTPDLSRVNAILVGHSHYDHLIDLPYILNSGKTKAPVFGNATMVNLLTNKVANILTNIEALAGGFKEGEPKGEWQYISNNRIRFMALRSMHAPHFHGITLYKGQVRKPRKNLPWFATGWKCGTPLAFVIDFLKPDQTVAYRIVFNDSAVDGRCYGFLPTEINNREVDLAILCMASFHEVKGYPNQYLKRINPKKIFIGHWEDFFRSQSKPVKVVRLSEMDDFIEQLPEKFQPAELYAPGACYRIELKD